MLKVTYDHQIFSMQQFGGISRYFYELARRVAVSEGFKVSVVAPFYRNSYLAEGGVKVNGFKTPYVKNTGRLVALANDALSPISTFVSCADVFHKTYYRTPKRLFRKRRPSVVTVFDMIHEKFPEDFPGDPTALLKKAAVKHADFIICISEKTRQDLIEILKVPVAKTSAIHLGFSLTHTNEVDTVPYASRPFILYVGLRRGYKNFDGFLKAYASSSWLSNEFDVIAFGGGKFTITENEFIASLGLSENRVRYMSGNDASLAYFYRQAFAFIYPSLYEGFGIPPLEAMSFTCPVMCSNTSSIPEVVGDAAYLFDPRSVESMRAAMEEVLGKIDIRTDLTQRGIARIEAFSWDRCATETKKTYQEVAQ